MMHWMRIGSLVVVVARVVLTAAPEFVSDFIGYNNGCYGAVPIQTYKSSPIITPRFQVTTWKRDLVDPTPYVFMSTTIGMLNQQAGPMIFSSSDLSLVYANPAFKGCTDARVQMLHGTPYLTFWDGTLIAAHGNGYCLFYDQNYNLKYNVSVVGLPSSVGVDTHDCEVTSDSKLLVPAYVPIQYDMTAAGGPSDGIIIDSVFQEIDPVTGSLLFEWRATDHFPITDSVEPYANESTGTGGTVAGWDFFHINSIQKSSEGNYIVSARHFDMVTYIDGKTGEPLWMLGGKSNQFKDLSGGNATNFKDQHHARLIYPDDLTQLTIFDNQGKTNAIPCTQNCSRGLRLSLDFADMTARLVHEWWHPYSLRVFAMGSVVVLPETNNTLVGWGKQPAWTEYAPDGQLVWDVQFSPFNVSSTLNSYRLYEMNWTGFPTWAPSIAVELDGSTMIHVSWNGATEVDSWALYTGFNNSAMSLFGIVKKSGFETALTIPPDSVTGPNLQVVALSKKGAKLGTTGIVNAIKGQKISEGTVDMLKGVD